MAQQLPPLPPIGAEIPDTFKLPPAIGEEVPQQADSNVIETPEGEDPDEYTDEGLPVFKAEASGVSDAAGAFYKFGKGFVNSVNPLPALQALYAHAKAADPAGVDPLHGLGGGVVGLVKDIGKAQGEQFTKAQQAYQEGRMSEAFGHTMAWLLPLLGPAAANAGEKIGQGEIAEGLGEATGLVAPFGARATQTGGVLPTAANARRAAAGAQVAEAQTLGATIPGATRASGPPRQIVPGLQQPLSPEDSAAVQYAQDRGIPLDASTATGSKMVRAVQGAVRGSPTGALVTEAATRRIGEELAVEGRRLAESVAGNPETPESAGAGVRSAVDDVIAEHKAQADTSYDAVRAFEADPRYARDVDVHVTGTLGGQEISVPSKQSMPLPVDMRVAKKALEPLYQQFLTNPARAADATWLRAIIDGPDFRPFSNANDLLSSLQKIARDKGGPAKLGVTQLHQAVDRAVALAGPDAIAALQAGRAASKSQHQVSEILKKLTTGTNNEPVRIHQKLAQPHDKGIDQLRELERVAPEALPAVARAIITDILEPGPAGTETMLGHAQQSANAWEKIGPSSRRILFPSTHRDITTFLHLRKKLAENPNPSGTAHVGIMGAHLALYIAHPLSGIVSVVPPYVLAKLLYTPRGIKLLTEGIRLSSSESAASKIRSQVNAAALFNLVGPELQPLAGAVEGEPGGEAPESSAQADYESRMQDDDEEEAVQPVEQ